jgi:hypothetical protein
MPANSELWLLNKRTNCPVERSAFGAQFGAPSNNAELSQTGVLDLPDAFTGQELEGLRTYLGDRPAYDIAGCISSLRVRDLLHRPEIMRGALQYRELARDHLGCEPVLAAIAAFWTSPAGEPSSLNSWHRDRDDFRALKVFIYITDVDEHSGAHQFIEGSHNPGLADIFYTGNCRQVKGLDEYFKGRIDTIVGPAGKTWAENTYGLHRGLRPTTRARCVLEYVYTQNAYPRHRERFDGFKLDHCPPPLNHFFQHMV